MRLVLFTIFSLPFSFYTHAHWIIGYWFNNNLSMFNICVFISLGRLYYSVSCFCVARYVYHALIGAAAVFFFLQIILILVLVGGAFEVSICLLFARVMDAYYITMPESRPTQ